MCKSSVTRSKFQLPSKDTFVANVSNPRSVNGFTNFKSPWSILAEESSREVNCDIFPVVERKSENMGKRNKLRSTCLITLKSDQFSRLIVKEWASSKATMRTGLSLDTWGVSNLPFFFKNSVSIWQDAAGRKPRLEASFGRMGER
jgi:hypothetical protein